MKIAVITDDILKEELLATGKVDQADITWLTDPCIINGVDCYIDLLFDQTKERKAKLEKLHTNLIIISDTLHQLELPEHFIRINAWPTLLRGKVIEASGSSSHRAKTESVLGMFGKEISWLPAKPGFIIPRVISMIVNEAYLALGEKVSSRDDIDIAMKLGTNYPYGPFEWSKRIGLHRINHLLETMAIEHEKYRPAQLLSTEAKLP